MMSEEFVRSLESLPGLDVSAFLKAMSEPPSVSIRLNRRKWEDAGTLGYAGPGPVAWCASGFYLAERPSFTINPLLHAGAFYVQDASSMIYETIVRTLVDSEAFQSPPMVLDLCAAPGGKTTAMINALPDGSHVVANELMPKRASVLRENLIKWGYPRIMVTNSRPSALGQVVDGFDLMAVDAPCSGEGMMRKDPEARAQWSPGLVRSCAALQREILADALPALKPGGYLIYSTCTFNRTENEEQAEWLLNEQCLEPVDLDFPSGWGIGTAIGSDLPVLRFMPHLTRGEGLTAIVMRKPGVPPHRSPAKTLDTVRRKAKVILDGIPHVSLKGKVEVPASEWCLSTDFPRNAYPEVELDLDRALSYLRHEPLRLDAEVPRGFVTVSFRGLPLGFVKNIGARANNLYPAEWRIRNL